MTTIVTMFFNLKKLVDATESVRPPEFYVENGKPTLDLAYPMVIFCDQETRPFLESYRKHPTIYIEKPLVDYEFYQTLWPIVVENRKTNPSVDNRNTASYFLLCMFKLHALKLAKDAFPSTHLAWIDLGASHVVRSFSSAAPAMLDRPNHRLSCCYIHYRSPDQLYPIRQRNGLAGQCGIAGTIFTVEKTYLDRVYAAMFGMMYTHISLGVGHTDEQIFVYLYDKHPEWFTLYFGDYFSCLTNYHSNVEDDWAIQNHFIDNARRAGRPDLVELAQQRVQPKTGSTVVIVSGKILPEYLDTLIEGMKDIEYKIASVWENEAAIYIDKLRRNNFMIVKNRMEEQTIYYGQTVGVVNGLAFARQLGFEYAARIRFDVLCSNLPLYLEKTKHLYKEKFLAITGIQPSSTDIYFLDIVVVGRTDELSKLYGFQPFEDYYTKKIYVELFLLRRYTGKYTLSRQEVKDIFAFSLDICKTYGIDFTWWRPHWWMQEGRTIPDMKVVDQYCRDSFIWT